MKHASLLLILCMLFSFSAVAQSAAPENTKTKRITITTKKIDDNGKTITETWIAEGDDPDKILQEMAINPGVMQEIEVDVDIEADDEERLFLIRSAEDNMIIEGKLDRDVDAEEQKVVVIAKNIEVYDEEGAPHDFTWTGNKDNHHKFAFARMEKNNSNCAALGVYANNRSEEYGARINRIIGKSAAEKAGLKQGDIIKKIEEFDVSDFQSLHFALANFLPGDEVNVDYTRDGKYMHTTAALTNWSDIPGHEFRARTDCGEPELPDNTSRDEDPDIDDPTGVHNLQPLELTDARVYPNPSDGVFALSFTPQPGPLSVMITDVNGKVVYSDQNVNAGGHYQRDINISDVPQGNYIISVTQGGKVYTHQISKQ